jgi:type IV pilus assembly protein PilM
MNGAELKQALKFEAQKHVPFPLAEVNMDGCILKDDLPDNKMLVLLAAVKKEFIRQRLRSLELAGIRANVAEIDSLALVNAFNFNYPLSETPGLKAVALLNIGATHTNVDIIEEGITRLSRDIQIAGNNFSQKVADTLGIDLKTAEGIKISPSGDQYGRMMTGLEAVFTALSAEIRNSFDYFESQSASSVAKIFISGGGSLFMGFRDKLRSMLNLDVDYWDPFKKIKIGSQIEAEKLKALSSQLVVAAGMALRL